MTSRKIELKISNQDYLKDHRTEGRSILPAVESLQYLARCASELDPPPDVLCSYDAKFSRFIELPPSTPLLKARVELKPVGEKLLSAHLLTKKQAGRSGIVRTVKHVEVNFGTRAESWSMDKEPLMERGVALEGVGIRFSSRDLYRDLVPFGPCFQNVTGSVFLSDSGAVGTVVAAKHPSPRGPLGNGFVLDGAFHLACAWGQRYEGLLTFPVGYNERKIFSPCKTGEEYWCRIMPAGKQDQNLLFDIFIFDKTGNISEACLGAVFNDVSFGRLTPPAWIQQDAHKDQLESLRKVCTGLSILELDSMSSYYQNILTPREKKRWSEMGTKRARDFGSSRIALKLLTRQILKDKHSPCSELETLAEDGIHPKIPADLPTARYCSASHDPRFTVAVASRCPIGVDVEMLSEKVTRGAGMFLGDNEQLLVSKSPLGTTETLIRIWTVKEAAAKALDMNLAQAFRQVQVLSVKKDTCEVVVRDRHFMASCAQIENHVVTIISICD